MTHVVMIQVQDIKIEIKLLKKIQTEVILEIKILRSQTKTNKTLRGKLHQHNTRDKKRISGTEEKIEEMDTSVNEYVKSKKFQAQNIQEIQDSIKRPNLKIIGIKEEETQVKGIKTTKS